jgi:hypothetical protein
MSIFSKKEELKINYDSRLGPDFLRFLERAEEVDDQSRMTKNFLEMKSLEWETNLSEMKRELKYSKEELLTIKSKIGNLKNEFMQLVTEFKTTGNSEDLEKLNYRIENFQMDKFITRVEFVRLAKERLRL